MAGNTIHPALQELIDKENIRDVLYKYCRGVDRVHQAEAREVYFPDATEDHGVYRGTGQGFVDRPSMADPQKKIVHHCLGQTMIELNGDYANCETYFVSGMFWHPKDGEPYFADVRGRYLDRVEKREGEWRIAQRVAVLDVTQQRPLDPEWEIHSHFIEGTRWPEDLVYRFEDLPNRVRP